MLRIMIVDDHGMFCDALSRVLSRFPDIEVVAQAASLAAARAKLEGIDVVLADRNLPDGDGLELAGTLREASPGAALLVMSTTLGEVHPGEALDAGAAGVVDKVAYPEEIAAQIRAVRWPDRCSVTTPKE
jgi:DNA-binding NarL/FixJ family response regulator